MNKVKLGFAICGSFCNMARSIDQLENLVKLGYDVLPIMSFNAYSLDTKFGKAKDFIEKIENLTSKHILNSLTEVEPIGPKGLTDIMIICPCTGNTLGKICHAISDTPVTLAVKSHLRVKKPLVVALASNDALGASFKNVSKIMNTKHIYMVPLSQDDCISKPNSLVAHFDLVPDTIDQALQGKQIQPVFRSVE